MAKTKKTNQKTIAIILVVVVLIIIGYKMLTSEVENVEDTLYSSKDENNSPGTNSSLAVVGSGTILKRGSKSSEVKQLQKHYNDNVRLAPEVMLAEDGIYGAKTEAVVLKHTSMKSISLINFINMTTPLDGNVINGFGDWLNF